MNNQLSVFLNLQVQSPSSSPRDETESLLSSLSSRSEASFASSLSQQVVNPLYRLRSLSAPLPEKKASLDGSEIPSDSDSLNPHSAPLSTLAPTQLPIPLAISTTTPSTTQGIFLPPHSSF